MASSKTVTSGLFGRLASLYTRMEQTYEACATEAGLTCRDCASNCCLSYFQHHTYIEWIYLIKGIRALPQGEQATIMEKAHAYMNNVRQRTAEGKIPDAMCPINRNGLCSLYKHRLMICRMHGTRNIFTLPNGTVQEFSGCSRYVTLIGSGTETQKSCPPLDRTPLYKELAALEMELYKKVPKALPRVNLCIAEMLLHGAPDIR